MHSILLLFVLLLGRTALINCTYANQRLVKVASYTIPVIEDGYFNLYELHQATVELHQYPAFYFTKEVIPLGTDIRNENNQTIAYIIGQHLNYYPIAPIKGTMYCSHYTLEQVTAMSKGKIVFHELEFTLPNFKDTFVRIAEQNTQCIIYV
nr:unnamed protein product [Callosobruchus analis]